MQKIHILENPIQDYAWGSYTALAALRGQPTPSPGPEAELWMGAHPKAPSVISIDGRTQALSDWIASAPEDILGRSVSRRYNNCLPYLFKVLAIEKPLSIQAHPNQEQARKGYARENQSQIPLDAPHRNYKDDNHKPECICALTPFTALCGFRPADQITALMDRIHEPELKSVYTKLSHLAPEDGLRTFFHGLMSLDDRARDRIIMSTLSRIQQMETIETVYAWVVTLQKSYPDDIGILAPLFLNLVVLAPGEALYLPAGELHAYLQGVGVELMANSDNVLRGGLTPKHVDVPQLLHVLNFLPREIEVLRPAKRAGNERVYSTPAAEFVLSAISISKDRVYHSAPERSIEILLCVEGAAWVETPDAQARIELPKGSSVVIPAAVSQYVIRGAAEVYKAAVPI